MFAPDVEVLLPADRIAARVRSLGEAITRDYRGKDLVVVGVLKGSFVFFADLVRSIDLPVSIDFLEVASYGSETESSGVVRLNADLTHPIEGRHVLLVEDIVDTGLTMRYLLDNLQTRHPSSVAVCALLEKPARLKVEVPVAYSGFDIADEFVVGYGLDHDQKYRNLPFLGVVRPSP
ncbi:MAG TPA: hypoxanthine phosphoribosyltransferase [Vulgatibacter sp.]